MPIGKGDAANDTEVIVIDSDDGDDAGASEEPSGQPRSREKKVLLHIIPCPR